MMNRDYLANVDMTVSQAISLMLDGHADRAIRILMKSNGSVKDALRMTALGCAYAILDKKQKALELLREVSVEHASQNTQAIRLTGLAYLAMHSGETEKFRRHMEEAIEIDPKLPLPWLSLGLHHFWQSRDLEAAREILSTALELAPQSYIVHRQLLGLEASAGNLARARELYDQLPRGPDGKGPPAALPVTLWLASTPLRGALIVLLLLVLVFVPYLPLPILGGWLILSLLSYRQLLRISGRLAFLPAAYLIPILSALLLRLLILGRLYP